MLKNSRLKHFTISVQRVTVVARVKDLIGRHIVTRIHCDARRAS